MSGTALGIGYAISNKIKFLLNIRSMHRTHKIDNMSGGDKYCQKKQTSSKLREDKANRPE